MTNENMVKIINSTLERAGLSGLVKAAVVGDYRDTFVGAVKVDDLTDEQKRLALHIFDACARVYIDTSVSGKGSSG